MTGGSESAISIAGIGGFNAMKALSEGNDSPETASRPFDKDRDGFVMGEGAAAVILEEYEHAKARGAKIYAEMIGGGMSADAHHLTAPHPEGLGARNVMRAALKDNNTPLEAVDYINVHGTSTPLGDIGEIKAVQQLFGDHAYNLNISSTKSMTGHLLGAAGAIEAFACLKAIEHQIVPPTINHFTDDEAFDPKLNFTFNKAQKREIKVALSNTFGFGGHNALCGLSKIGRIVFKGLFNSLFLSEEDKLLARTLKGILGTSVGNIELYKLALSHSSSRSDDDSNERLEYLGDAVLGSIVAEYLFKKFPFKDEGFLTEIRSRIVKRDSMNAIALKLSLNSLIQTDGGFDRNAKSFLGNALEALIGSIFLDKEYKFTYNFVVNSIILPHIDMADLVEKNHNFKSILIEWGQKNAKKVNFRIVDEEGANHSKLFTAQVFIVTTKDKNPLQDTAKKKVKS